MGGGSMFGPSKAPRRSIPLVVQLASAEMLWVDTRGLDFKGVTFRGRSEAGRLPFKRQALDDLDVLSLITMAAQEAWEAERSYTPSMPELSGRID